MRVNFEYQKVSEMERFDLIQKRYIFYTVSKIFYTGPEISPILKQPQTTSWSLSRDNSLRLSMNFFSQNSMIISHRVIVFQETIH